MYAWTYLHTLYFSGWLETGLIMRDKTDKQTWETYAQLWELGYWANAFKNNHETKERFAEFSTDICKNLLLTEALIKNQRLLDVGCGPTGRLASLVKYKGEKGYWAAIDPLLEHYQGFAEVSLDGYDKLLSVPCEELQPDLVNSFDIVVSLNALDHGYDFKKCISNIFQYLKPNSGALLSFDCFNVGDVEDMTHPIRITSYYATEVMVAAGFTITQLSRKPIIADRTNWGGGEHFHWYLLKP